MRGDELAEVHFDLKSSVRHEAGLLEPTAGEFEPRPQ